MPSDFSPGSRIARSAVAVSVSAQQSFASMEQARRHTIIEMHIAGYSPPEIHKIMKYPRSTIFRSLKREEVAKEVSKFRRRLEAVVRANGSHIERGHVKKAKK